MYPQPWPGREKPQCQKHKVSSSQEPVLRLALIFQICQGAILTFLQKYQSATLSVPSGLQINTRLLYSSRKKETFKRISRIGRERLWQTTSPENIKQIDKRYRGTGRASLWCFQRSETQVKKEADETWRNKQKPVPCTRSSCSSSEIRSQALGKAWMFAKSSHWIEDRRYFLFRYLAGS